MKKYNVIIVGAGPSGLSCALNLKKLGITDILVIEKYKFPRYKCCAGYITKKTKKVYEELGLNIDNCGYNLIKDFNILYKNKKRQTIENKFMYTNKNIDRTELDNKFFLLAKEKKINILENTFIISHDIDKNIITLNNKEKLLYENLVFADGTLGFGNRYQKIKNKNIAMQLVTKYDSIEKIDIHFGITKKGYGWVSTYNGIINIGLTDVYNKNNNYNEIFLNFIKELDLKVDTKNIKGAFAPIGIRKPIINNNIYYVGDALGACDPLTLSGLRYGLKSGEICAKSIKEKNSAIYIKYVNLLKVKFFLMKIILHLFYLKISLFMTFNIGCKYFGKIITRGFNFFVNKK